MTKINKGIQFIKKISDGIYNFIDGYNHDTLYLFDFEDAKEEYLKIKDAYKATPELLDIKDFSTNFAFSFYLQKGLLDHQQEAKSMADQVYAYISELEDKKEL